MTISLSTLLLRWITPALLWLLLSALANAQPHSRRVHTVQVRNQNKRPVEVYFVPPDKVHDEEWILVSNPILMPGTNMTIKARAGQLFVMTETKKQGRPSQFQQKEQQQDSIPLLFTTSNEDEQVIVLTKDWTLNVEDAQTKAQSHATILVEKCKLAQGQANTTISLAQCVQDELQSSIEKIRDNIRLHNHIRKDVLANEWEEFACEDYTLESSDPLYQTRWYNEREQESYDVSVLHDYTSSQIHWIEGFIDPHECHAIKQASAQQLHRAKVHDGQGGNHFSEHRKAWQASVKIPWKLPDHPLTQLSRRAYDYTNHVLGINLQHHGQEHLNSIQYFGEGNETEQPDRYHPHCDGPCNGRLHKRGLRIATMVMYW